MPGKKNCGKCHKGKSRLHQNADFLTQLAACGVRAGGKLRTLVGTASTEQLLCLVEICLNLLHNRVPLNPGALRRLRSHAERIRALSRARSEQRARQLLLERNQSGRGIPAVAAILATTVLPMIAEYYIKRKSGSASG
jgi:hypothetical protein